MPRWEKIFLWSLVAFLVSSNAITAFWLIRREASPNTVFDRVFGLIEDVYLYPIDLQKCRYYVLSKLNSEAAKLEAEEGEPFPCLDRHSGFLPPQEAEARSIRGEGEYGGISISFGPGKDGRMTVIEVRTDGPAARAGMKKGDVLVRFKEQNDSRYTEIKTLEDAIKMRGAAGSVIFVVVERDGEKMELTLTRETIKLNTVFARAVDKTIGYVQISNFDKHTADDVEAALDAFVAQGVSRAILDLRENPGGRLEAPLEMLFYFSDNPSDVLYTMRTKKETVTHTIGDMKDAFIHPETNEKKLPGKFKDLKLVILINGRSASASEVFAGTMKDWNDTHGGHFILVGGKSFGKGVGQFVALLPGGSSFSLTAFEYLVGNKKTTVQNVGITPHHEVPDTRNKDMPQIDMGTENDNQFKKAMEILKAM